MTPEQLKSLALEIAKGRPEGQAIDWKRQWHDLRQQAQREELRKDIAALANSCGTGPAHLIFGLKGGKFYDAPLPRDEAALQEIIKEIVPPPSVRLEEVVVDVGTESKKVSIATILPPYDRPYITQIGAHNLVPVRRGSSSGTATRFELDSLYRSDLRTPALRARWEYWPSKGIPKGRGVISETLLVPKPLLLMSGLEARLQANIDRYTNESRQTGYPPPEAIADFEAKYRIFVYSLRSRENLVFWYYKLANRSSYGIPFSVILSNTGNHVATEPRVKISFPDWLILASGQGPQRPRDFVPEPYIPPSPRQSGTTSHRADTRGHFPSLLGSTLSLPPIKRPEPQDGAWVSDDMRTVTFWASRITHKRDYRIQNPATLMALPTAPLDNDEILVQAELFCEELTDWIIQPLGLSWLLEQ